MATSKLSHLCDTLLEAGWLLAAITTPLFVSIYTSRSVEPDKLAVLRIIAAGLAGVWFVGWIDRRAIMPRQKSDWRNPLTAPILLLIGAYAVSTVASLSPRISWAGAYPRPEGMYAILCYALIFLIVAQTLRTRTQLNRLISTFILTSVPILLYAIVQYLGLDPLPWSNEIRARVGSTLGNPIFLGAYAIVILPLTISRLMTVGPMPARRRAARIAGRLVYAALALLQVIGIFLSGSRGPFLGALAGLFLVALLMTWIWQRRRWAAALLAAAGIGVIGLAVVNAAGVVSSSSSGLARLTSLTISAGDTSTARLWYWDNASRLVMPHDPLQYPDGAVDPLAAWRPLLGYGPDTLYFAFRQTAAPGLETIQSYDVTIDRSHNETWDVLAQLGWLGWLAYQVMYGAVFYHGLHYLGLIQSRRERIAFIATWTGVTAAGGLAASTLADVRYLGLGLGAGNVGAVILFAIIQILRRRPAAPLHPLSRADLLLTAALMSGLVAHLLEIQVGLALATTRVAFWILAALLIAIGSRRLSDNAAAREEPPVSVVHHALIYGLITAAIMCTLLFAFTTYASGLTNTFALIWRALFVGADASSPRPFVISLWLLTLATAGVMMTIERHQKPEQFTRSEVAHAAAVFAGTAIGLPLLFELALSAYLIPLAQPPDPVVISAVLEHAGRAAHTIDLYLIGLAIIAMLIALSLAGRQPDRTVRARRPGLAAAVVSAIALAAWLHIAELNPIRADVYHKLGLEYESAAPRAAVAVLRQAVRLSPQEDYYFLAWGRMLMTQANAASTTTDTPTRFSEQTTLVEVQLLSDDQLAGLNRLDLLYAAQAALQRARGLNPLYPDHTLNLARFYLPELPVNTEARARLAALANDYFAQAVRLSPNNAAYWNEWARFDQDYRSDLRGALNKLVRSLQINPAYVDTYLQQGKVYAAENDWEAAAAAYEHAAALRPDWPDVFSALAFAQYQRHDLTGAVAAYARYIELAPDAPDRWEAYKNLALIYQQLGEDTQAIEQARLAAASAPIDLQPQLAELINRLQSSAP